MIQQLLVAHADNPLRVVDTADFDGTNDYMLRGADLTGIADSKTGILSVWARLDGGDGTALAIIDNSDTATSTSLEFHRRADNTFYIVCLNVFDVPILLLGTSATFTAGATWRHVLASWDLAAGARHLYINDVSDAGVSTSGDFTIDYTRPNFGIGIRHSDDSAKFNGCLADLYFAAGQYLDFSLVANRRKFISNSGKPVHLGATGALPLGVAPVLYAHIDDAEAVANFATNRGTGGDFTITGTLTTGSTSPSD